MLSVLAEQAKVFVALTNGKHGNSGVQGDEEEEELEVEALALCLFITDGAQSPPLQPTCFARPGVVPFASELARPTAGTTVLTAVNRRGSQRFCWEMHAAEAAAGE
jgi:hypothetical protein